MIAHNVALFLIIPLTVYGIVSLVVLIVTIPIDFTFSSDFSTLACPICENITQQADDINMRNDYE